MRAEDLDRRREPWLYRPPSGGKTYHLEKSREVWIGPVGRAILTPFLEQIEPGKTLFRLAKYRGGGTCAVSVKFLRQRMDAACAAIGVDPIRPNQLRHAKATAVQREYEDDRAVADALGNTPEVARQVYTDSPARAAARRIAEATG
jgi:integrase